MNDLEGLAHLLGHNWLLVLTAVIVVWLLFTRLVETSEAAAKLLGPLGRHIVRSYRQRSDRYRADVAQEAKLLAQEIIPKVVPQDYNVVKEQLRNVIDRITDLEIENSAMRGFIVYDEEWHFHDDLVHVRYKDTYLREPRMQWGSFLDQWKSGWRPSVLES